MKQAALLVAFAAALPVQALGEDWAMRLPKEPEAVVYRGIINADQAGYGARQGMMYGPGLIGFAAVLAGHAAFQETQTNHQQQKLQEAADKVLLPYRTALSDYSYAALMRQALDASAIPGDKVLVKAGERPAARWLIDSLPAFGMAQDSGSLVLDLATAVYPPDAPEPLYRNVIRVVSRPREGEAYWSANGTGNLKEQSARLLGHALDVLMVEAAGKAVPDGPEKTVRYLQGTVEKMERASIVVAHCDRVVLRTLRGWLMSVPVKPQPAATPCTPLPLDL